jgi:hypothetical protein
MTLSRMHAMIVAIRCHTLQGLISVLQDDYPTRWAQVEERSPRAPGHEGGNESNMKAFGDDYQDLGNGGYRHICSTNSDGDSYEVDE